MPPWSPKLTVFPENDCPLYFRMFVCLFGLSSPYSPTFSEFGFAVVVGGGGGVSVWCMRVCMRACV